MYIPFRVPLLGCSLVLLGLLTRSVFSDHGPTSSGGALTKSGRTLDEGHFELSLGFDFTNFEDLDDADIERRALKLDDDHAHFEALDWSAVQMFELTYGISDSFQIGASIGIYRGNDFREGSVHHDHHDPEVEIDDVGDIQGLTDLWFTGKWQALTGPLGQLAPYAGIKIPTGRDDLVGHGGHALEPSVQPGTGAFDFLFGTGYTFPVNARLDLHASGQYIWRMESSQFKVGDRIDGGIAAVFRLIEDAMSFPQVNLIGEVNVRHIFEEEEDGDEIENSGGTVLFLSPGVQLAFNNRVSLAVVPQFPVVQDLNEEQQETSFKVFTALSILFSGGGSHD